MNYFAPQYRVLFALLLSALALRGAPVAEDYEGKEIVAIQFQPETQPYPAAELEGILGIQSGRPLRLAEVRTAIERLYATGRYAEIVVEALDADRGVALRFLTTPNYFVGRVSVLGAPEPPNSGVLVNAAKLELGTLYQEERTKQAIENLRETLRGNGLFSSRIEPRYEYDSETQQVNIRFEIVSGPRAKYTFPAIAGKPEKSAAELLRASHWKRIWSLGWRSVNEARTQSGVERIRASYQKQGRLMARVRLTGMSYDPASNRATPALEIEGGPRLTIRTSGAKVSRGKLKQLVPVYEERSIDRDLLVEGARNLTEYFEHQGYFQAKVDFEEQAASGGGKQEIVYKIDRGDRHRVLRVEIHGNRYFDTAAIRERLYVRPASFPEFRHGRYSEDSLRRDLDAIEELYRSNGFRDVKVTSRVEPGAQGRERDLAVHIQIMEGAQWRVASLELRGASQQNEKEIRALAQSSPGQPFSDANVAIDRDGILEYYYNRGYADATFQWNFQPGATPQRVELQYTVQEGTQRFVRGVRISGLSTTDPGLVEERVMLGPGEPISRAKILETQRRLYSLGIFAKVDVALQNPEGDERDKYVLLQAEESKRYTLTGGVGAEIARIGGSTTLPEAPAGKAGFSPRVYFDVTRRNFFGQGHIVSFKGRASTLQRRGILSYQAPQFQGNPDLSLTFSATYDDSRDVRTFTSKRQEGAVQVGQKLSRASTMLYRFTYRRVSVSDLKINRLLVPLFSQSTRLGILGASFFQDRRDSPTDATKGIYNTLDVGWASRFFGSQTDFTTFLGRNATYHPLGRDHRYVLARSLTFGWLQTLRKDKDVPLPERFFSGGSSAHRGFPENQAGPRDTETGFPLGGKALLMNQTELRFPLLGDNLGGVFFHDVGNVYDGLNKISFRVKQHGLADFNYMVHAVGFGVRYRTPVGPLRVDLAYVPNSPRFFGLKGTREQLLENRGVPEVQRMSRFQFHFSLGQSF